MRRLNIQLPVSIFKEGKHFIAYAPALDLSTSGNSYEQVRRRFHEIVLIFLEELVKKGAMEEVLHSLGWRQMESSGPNFSGIRKNPTSTKIIINASFKTYFMEKVRKICTLCRM
jgi:hypothetical protein